MLLDTSTLLIIDTPNRSYLQYKQKKAFRKEGSEGKELKTNIAIKSYQIRMSFGMMFTAKHSVIANESTKY